MVSPSPVGKKIVGGKQLRSHLQQPQLGVNKSQQPAPGTIKLASIANSTVQMGGAVN
jgi:hypothetical protein